MGQRPLNQGSIIFEEAVISKKYMVIPNPDLMKAMGGLGLAYVNGGMALVFAGLAMAAFDEALRYAKVRIQSGKPLFGHQNIRLKLMKMFTQVEAARANTQRMAVYNRLNPMTPSVSHAVAPKCFSTETAFSVASEAMQIFGGFGLARDALASRELLSHLRDLGAITGGPAPFDKRDRSRFLQ
jgi:alkylation response protein AidB-like acyl-CoA dehydrogenase